MGEPGGAVLAGVEVVKWHAARGSVAGRAGARTQAVAGVSVTVREGEVYGLVGGSGAGKSSFARVLALLNRPDAGEVRYGGKRVDDARGEPLRELRRAVQIVFQDPGAALDPLQRVEAAIAEPLDVHRLHRGPARGERVRELLNAVGLPADDGFRTRFPRELSGGERQRVAIARALACDPRALILDEPVSALNISIRGQVLNLLLELRERLGLAMLLIAHDLAVVGAICDRVGVLLAGRLVEEGDAAAVLDAPLHPYTRTLVQAATPDDAESPAADASGDDRAGAGRGCCWAPRCPRAAEACAGDPVLRPARQGRLVACHFPEES